MKNKLYLSFLLLVFASCSDDPVSGENNKSAVLDLQNPVLISRDDGLARSQVHSVTSCPNGDVWFGYGINGSGITRLRNNYFHTYTDSDGLQKNSVYALACDASNRVWIGYGISGSGLTVYHDQSFSHFTTEDGLHSNYIESLTVTSGGSIFIAYGRNKSGVTRFN